MGKIHVISLDFDGCLANNKYLRSKNIIEANQSFLDQLKTENSKYTRNIAFIGSDRQSWWINHMRFQQGLGSCFSEMPKIAAYLGFKFNPFLLADVYGNLDHGTSYERAIELSVSDKEHANWEFDDSKATILYAQMHKIAKENPYDEIEFDFYDRRWLNPDYKNDILEWLRDFYGTYRELIPPNVTLRLNHYKGEKVTNIATIKPANPNSFIDASYAQTVKDMATIAQQAKPREGKLYTAFHVKPIDLKNRVALGTAVSSSSMATPVATALSELVASLSRPGTGGSAQHEYELNSQRYVVLAAVKTPFSNLEDSDGLRNIVVASKLPKLDCHPLDQSSYTFWCHQSKRDTRLEDYTKSPIQLEGPNLLLNELDTLGNKMVVSELPVVQIDLSSLYPKSYTDIWEESTPQETDIGKIKALLKDYTKEDSMFGSLFGRLFTRHWNRHHVDEVRVIVETKYETAQDLMNNLKLIIRAEGGSLDRRIRFIEYKIGTTPSQAPLL